mmetsp:Transcript_59953/g.118924  ORF Transcript_59953/g.118924 Transcript_59953/m.118924 type:complete len:102 (+) Transcript_59953:23-328(+)
MYLSVRFIILAHESLVPPLQHSLPHPPKLAGRVGSAIGLLPQYELLKLPNPMYVHIVPPLHTMVCKAHEEIQQRASRFKQLAASTHPSGASENPENSQSEQ